MGRRTIVRVWVEEIDERGRRIERGTAVEVDERAEIRLEVTKPDGEKVPVDWWQA